MATPSAVLSKWRGLLRLDPYVTLHVVSPQIAKGSSRTIYSYCAGVFIHNWIGVLSTKLGLHTLQNHSNRLPFKFRAKFRTPQQSELSRSLNAVQLV